MTVPKKLTVLVTSTAMFNWPEIRKMIEQGHTVHGWPEMLLELYDIIWGPNCWLMDEAHRPYMADSVKAARARRYPKK